MSRLRPAEHVRQASTQHCTFQMHSRVRTISLTAAWMHMGVMDSCRWICRNSAVRSFVSLRVGVRPACTGHFRGFVFHFCAAIATSISVDDFEISLLSLTSHLSSILFLSAPTIFLSMLLFSICLESAFCVLSPSQPRSSH